MSTPRTSSAARRRRYRERQQNGEIVIPVVVNEFIAMALVEAKFLTEREAENRILVASAVGRLLAVWAKMWTRPSR
jgi:hypothetical protein